eukprot:tig00020660_g12509.t1
MVVPQAGDVVHTADGPVNSSEIIESAKHLPLDEDPEDAKTGAQRFKKVDRPYLTSVHDCHGRPAIEDLHMGVLTRIRDAGLADIELQDLVYQMRGGSEQRASRAALQALEAAGRLTMLSQQGPLQDRRRWLPLTRTADFRPDPLQKAWIAYVYGEPSADSTIIF